MSSPCLSCPRNGKRVWICQYATVSDPPGVIPRENLWEGGKSGLASPDTGLMAMDRRCCGWRIGKTAAQLPAEQTDLSPGWKMLCLTSTTLAMLCNSLSEAITLAVFPDY